jgi:hypothetical protein
MVTIALAEVERDVKDVRKLKGQTISVLNQKTSRNLSQYGSGT